MLTGRITLDAACSTGGQLIGAVIGASPKVLLADAVVDATNLGVHQINDEAVSSTIGARIIEQC